LGDFWALVGDFVWFFYIFGLFYFLDFFVEVLVKLLIVA